MDFADDPDDDKYDEVIDDLVNGTSDEVDNGMKLRLAEVLVRHKKAFSIHGNDLGGTDIIKHRIDTSNAMPVRQPLRRHPPSHLDPMQQHVSDMLAQVVIQASDSPWASNIVLVKKKDGSLRCCIDYR